MSIPINVPLLGVGMTEGKIVEWLVADGTHVEEGAPIYVLETDKVEQEIDAPGSGTIRLIAQVGDTHDVGTRIAEIC